MLINGEKFNSKQLLEHRAEVFLRMNDLTEKSENNGGKLSKKDRAIWDKSSLEFDTLSEEISFQEAREKIDMMAAVERGQDVRGICDPVGHDRVIADAVKTAFKGGIDSRIEFKMPFRAMITPDSGSGGNALYQATSGITELQPDSDTAIFSKMNIINARNNTTYPFLDVDDRPSSQQKAYVDTLSEQSFNISAYTTSFKNYYTYILIHNDVLRDAQGDFGALVRQVSADAIRKDVLQDIIEGDGTSNKLTGLNSTSGIQTLASAGTSVTNFAELIKAKRLLLEKNVGWENVSVLMHPSISYQYELLTSATELQPLQPPAGIDALFNNWFTSTVIGNQEGGVGGSKVWIGDWSKVNVYGNETFSLVLKERAAERDSSIYMLVYRVDMKMWLPESMIKITGLRKTNIT